MADLPRYQTMGVQYADVPRVITATQQAAVQGLSNLERNLDRMNAYVEDAAVTAAKKAGLQYAVENPLTKDVVDKALKADEKIPSPGGGKYFQESYLKAQGAMLSSELQLEGQRKLSNVAAAIDAGAPVDLRQIQKDIKDMVDGYSSTLMAVDPEQSIRLRAAITTSGNALYAKAAERAVKIQMETYDAKLNQAVEQSKPLIETLISQKAGQIDPATGKPYDMEALFEVQRQPFYEAIKVTGSSKHIDEFNKVIKNAKLGAIQAKVFDPAFAGSAGQAFQKYLKGDFGNLSGLYAGLDQDSKDKVRDRMIKGYADKQQAMDMDKRAADIADSYKAAAITLQLLDANLPQAKREKLVKDLVGVKALNIFQAQTLMSPLEGTENTILHSALVEQVNRGTLDRGGAIEYKDKLSKTQFTSLLAHINSEQGKQATAMINLEAGIRQNAFITEDQKAKEKKIREFYTRELSTITVDKNGVERLYTPVEAAKEAINLFNNDKAAQNALAEQKAARTAIEKVFQAKNMKMPDLPIDQINFDNESFSNFSDGDRARLKQHKDKYMRSRVQ